jgi:hypothetical protein
MELWRYFCLLINDSIAICEKIEISSTYEKLILEFSDAQAGIFCSLFWV